MKNSNAKAVLLELLDSPEVQEKIHAIVNSGHLAEVQKRLTLIAMKHYEQGEIEARGYK